MNKNYVNDYRTCDNVTLLRNRSWIFDTLLKNMPETSSEEKWFETVHQNVDERVELRSCIRNLKKMRESCKIS